jgi:hypothetical protein
LILQSQRLPAYVNRQTLRRRRSAPAVLVASAGGADPEHDNHRGVAAGIAEVQMASQPDFVREPASVRGLECVAQSVRYYVCDCPEVPSERSAVQRYPMSLTVKMTSLELPCPVCEARASFMTAHPECARDRYSGVPDALRSRLALRRRGNHGSWENLESMYLRTAVYRNSVA